MSNMVEITVDLQVGQKVVIGGLEVQVQGSNGDQVRLGIDAPRDITVVRKELIVGSCTLPVKEGKHQGIVGKHDDKKHYGFIFTPGIEGRVYFKIRDIMEPCETDDLYGAKVEYRLRNGKKGLFAKSIKVIG